jgi:hypothetical protein
MAGCRPIEKGEGPMMQEGKSMIVSAGALIMAITVALLPSLVLGVRRSVPRCGTSGSRIDGC